jgi:hypothetical protein
MNELWHRLTTWLNARPDVGPMPRLTLADLPAPARLITSKASIAAWMERFGEWADRACAISQDVGVFRGGLVFGVAGLLAGFAAGWWFHRQIQRIVVEAHVTSK